MKESHDNTSVFSVVPLRDVVIFPRMVMPLFVGRERSIRTLTEAVQAEREVLLVTQRDPELDTPNVYDLYPVGVVARIVQLTPMPDASIKILVEGQRRARIVSLNEQTFEAQVQVLEDEPEELDARLVESAHHAFELYAKLNHRLREDAVVAIAGLNEPGPLADAMVPLLNLKIRDRQKLLEDLNPKSRLLEALKALQSELEILNVEAKIRERMQQRVPKMPKDFLLSTNPTAPMPEPDEFKQELTELEGQIASLPLSDEARKKASRELRKLKSMNPMGSEAAVIRNYLDWVLSVPWGKYSVETGSIKTAEDVLNKDHYGLEKPKERILEFLAVSKLSQEAHAPILCLVGPPGVGKTSLAQSIATATSREYVRICLGGVRDEAEIRGHRRTYIGALPGKIIQAMRRAGTNNPLILLDEIDKMGSDFRGDPTSALLEVLDPEQNKAFQDHFLDVDYDLSKVMFIATANAREQIPVPLLDRLEVIELTGYTEMEKHEIAMRHLIPKQAKMHGLEEPRITWAKTALDVIIRRYTRESGVRNLERTIAAIYRKLAWNWCDKKAQGVDFHTLSARITAPEVEKLLGAPRFRTEVLSDRDEVGMVNGLAYTSYGGTILEIEVAVLPGKGSIECTGSLGDVMKESVKAAWTFVRTCAARLGLPEDVQQTHDLHVHFPEGAVPKDGPSAGIAISTALVSALTGIPVHRDVAMTGEISIRGRVLAIGGLKEKTLAAKRAGIKTVLVPEENRKDVEDLPPEVVKALKFIFVTQVDQVWEAALAIEPEKLWKSA